MKRFDDQVVWITGAGSGIGHALALEMAARGARIAASGRRKDRLDALVQQLAAQGSEGFAVVCDVTDESAVQGAVDAIVEHFGQLDVLVANAGYAVRGSVEQLRPEDWRRQFETNVVGLTNCVRSSLPHLRQTGGRIGLVASVVSFLAVGGSGAYAASKFAVRGLGLALAQEVHGSGVSVTLLYPGYVESELGQVDNEGVFHAERSDGRPQRLMWKADRAARVMADAIAKRTREFAFTGHGKLATFVASHAPGLVHLLATRSSRAKKARDEVASNA